MNDAAAQGIPFASRDDSAIQGHWLLARLGKRVLRPGGRELTQRLLSQLRLRGADVVEFAPGLGHTAAQIVSHHPHSYQGIDRDPEAAALVMPIVEGYGTVRIADAADTGLAAASVDIVIGEAMLTMQGAKAKEAIITEAVRLLRPGGQYAIHELGLTPEDLPEQTKEEIRHGLARSIKVNARPMTIAEWRSLLDEHGLIIDRIEVAPMALLQPGRLVADEGLGGALRFAFNLLTHPTARRRVLAMRRTFRTYRDHLNAVAVVAHKAPTP